jgi:hypothetical protein
MSLDKAAGSAGEKDDRTGQFVRLSPAAHRRAVANKPVAFGIVKDRFRQRRFSARSVTGLTSCFVL